MSILLLLNINPTSTQYITTLSPPLSFSTVHFVVYKANANNNPPNAATPPLTMFAIAAPVEVAAAGVEVVDVVGAVVFVEDVVKVWVVERVPFVGLAVLAVLEVLVMVLLAVVEELAVYEGPGERVMVFVEVADPVADPEELELPLMWKGKEYWKIVESLTSEIMKPYVANLASGTAQVNFAAVLGRVARTSPICRCAKSLPSRSLIVMFSLAYLAVGCQITSKEEPGATS